MRIKINKKHYYEKYILIGLIILLFQYVIGLKIHIIDYFDELFAIILLIYYLFKTKLKINYHDCFFIFMLLLIIIFGLISNYFSGLLTEHYAILIDCLAIIKLYIVYFAIYNLTSNINSINILHKMYPIACMYIIMAFCGLILGYLFDISFFFKDESSVRYGIRAYSFIAANAGNFGYLVMGLFLIILFSGKNNVENKFLKCMCLVLILMTTKGPQILFVCIYMLFTILHAKKVKLFHVIITVMLGLTLGRYQIVKYFMNVNSARYILLTTSINITKKYFPIGSGFATFGSEMSRRYYSPIYSMFGIDNIYGLSRQYGVYITDNYWPMLIAQLGVIGTLSVASILFKIFKDINEISGLSINVKSVLMAIYVTFLIGSLGSAYYNTATGMFCFILIVLVLKSNYLSRKVEYGEKS